MRKLIKWMLFLAVLVAAGAAGYQPAKQYWINRNRVTWETEEVVRGDLTRYVNSTGTVEPVLKVSVGSVVSGPIVELNVDYNDKVKKGDLLARIDPRLFEAALRRDQATLSSSRAELQRVEAQLRQSLNNLQRGEKLREKSKGFLSDHEMDALVFEVKQLQAQQKLAEASIQQAEAALETSQANLNYCEIKAPVDGMILERKIDEGQTLAAAFQTPELFIVTPDLRDKVHVFASVDEADIGLIQASQADGRPVTFTVSAHPEDVFEGHIEQIRISSVANLNVVTYTVVVAAANPELKLLPGMTAEIRFEVDDRTDVLKIPRAALMFVPTDAQHVRNQDRKLIDGSTWKAPGKNDESDAEASKNDPPENEAQVEDDREDKAGEAATAAEPEPSAAQQKKSRNLRHVWVVEGDKLRAIPIRAGLSEEGYTELVSGELHAGVELVTGQREE